MLAKKILIIKNGVQRHRSKEIHAVIIFSIISTALQLGKEYPISLTSKFYRF